MSKRPSRIAGSVCCTALLIAIGIVPGAASAAPIIFTGSGTAAENSVSASASFEIIGNTLTIVLKNTSGSIAGKDKSGSTLSGLFFDLTGNPALTPVSATIAAGSIVQSDKCSTALCTATQTNVGGEWGYQATTFPGGADRGISSSGYLETGLPGNIGNFNNGLAGTELDDPGSLNGINFGIISAASGFDPNGGLANDPLIQDTVTFVLTGVAGLTNFDISDVSFQYGTSITEANITASCESGCTPVLLVPEPSALSMVGFALLALGAISRPSRRKA